MTEEASVNIGYRFDNSRFNLLSYSLADLYCPNVFALNISMRVIRACTEPATFTSLSHIVHDFSRLRSYTIESVIQSHNLVRLVSNQSALFFTGENSLHLFHYYNTVA